MAGLALLNKVAQVRHIAGVGNRLDLTVHQECCRYARDDYDACDLVIAVVITRLGQRVDDTRAR